MKVAADFKLMFFDRQAVTDPAEKAARRNEAKFGAFVMRSARKSIKTKKGASRPGQPPHAHTGYETERNGKRKTRYFFRDSILFGKNPNGGVVVGPVFRSGSRTRPTIPESLEFGATVGIGGKTRPRRNIAIQPRPFMGPALDKERPKFAGMFRDSITR